MPEMRRREAGGAAKTARSGAEWKRGRGFSRSTTNFYTPVKRGKDAPRRQDMRKCADYRATATARAAHTFFTLHCKVCTRDSPPASREERYLLGKRVIVSLCDHLRSGLNTRFTERLAQWVISPLAIASSSDEVCSRRTDHFFSKCLADGTPRSVLRIRSSLLVHTSFKRQRRQTRGAGVREGGKKSLAC